MARLIQTSFAKGALAPAIAGRVDIAAYQIGVAIARNCIVHNYGGISARQGTRWIAPVADHTYAPRLIGFEFKTTDTYLLEFGDLYIRFIRNDGHVLEPDKTITAATQANPVVITAVAHGFNDSDEVFIKDVEGMTEINNKRYYIANPTADTFELTDQVTGADIDGTSFGAYTSGGTVARVYEIESPFTLASLSEMTHTQSADVLTLCHKNIGAYELRRFDNDDWVIEPAIIGPDIDPPADNAVTDGGSGTTYRYRVTAIDTETNEESLPGLNDTEFAITGITKANPGVVTATGHGFENGDEIQQDNIGGMTELNGKRYFVANKTTNTYELEDSDGVPVDTTNFNAYTSGGIARQTFVRVNGGATPAATVTWSAVAGANRYAVYREDNGIFGLIGETELLTFDAGDIIPDVSETPPAFRNPFDGPNNQPGAVGYYEQRRVFGGTLDKPDTSEFSQVGNQSNFNRSQPLRPDDAITATLNSLTVNEIRHYVAQNDLLTFTSGSEWRINAGPDAIFGPETIKQKPQTFIGSSWRRPIVAGNTILFVEDNEQVVRNLGYSLQIDGYTGSDLTILSAHLTEGKSITDWTYARTPESRVYATRSDGAALTMSFEQDQEVIAWTEWDTQGKYESVEALRGGGPNREDSVYFVVRRVLGDGTIVRYIEVFRQLFFEDVRDYFGVDSGLTYYEPIPISGVSLANPGVITTAVPHGIVNEDEIDIRFIEWLPDIDSFNDQVQPDQLNQKRYFAANVTANTLTLQVKNPEGEDLIDVDTSEFNAYVSGGEIRIARTTFTGMDHVEGKSLSILADGDVYGGTSADTIIVCENGCFELPAKASIVHAGLPRIADIETLALETGEGSIQGLIKGISSVTIRFLKSRGIWLAQPNKKVPKEDWVWEELLQRRDEAYGDPIELVTDDQQIPMPDEWDELGKMFLRQPDPLPMTILALMPDVQVEDNE